MDILKYFYEEPTSLEALSPDLDPDARRHDEAALPLEAWLNAPRYYRGYLAGTDLATQRMGLTALARPTTVVDALLDWLAGMCWMVGHRVGIVEPIGETDVRRFLLDPSRIATLVCAEAVQAEASVVAVMGQHRRETIPALRQLLNEAYVVFFPEPAHHGYDWSFFSAHPMRTMLVEALQKQIHDTTRCFAIPYQEARSEERFYFETYDLSKYAAYEVG